MVGGFSMTFRAEHGNRLAPRREEVSQTNPLMSCCRRSWDDNPEIKNNESAKLGNGFQQPKRLIVNWSSYKGLTVDTLAHRGDEGRGYLR